MGRSWGTLMGNRRQSPLTAKRGCRVDRGSDQVPTRFAWMQLSFLGPGLAIQYINVRPDPDFSRFYYTRI